MATTRHSMAQLEGAGALDIAFRVLNTAGTPSITNVSPPLAQAADVSVVDTDPGEYTITINPFRGPLGYAYVFMTAQTAGLITTLSSGPTYTNDSLAFAILVTSNATRTDASVLVRVLAV